MKIPFLPAAVVTTVMLLFAFKPQPLASQLIIRHHFEALNKHDLVELAKDYAGNAKVRSASWDGNHIGPEAVTEAYARYFHTSPDLKYTITDVIYSDTSAVISYTSTGTMINLEGGSPAYMQGKRYTLNNCTVMHIKAGKIVDEATYFDQVSFLRQMDFFNQK
ncbi:hypothetical protein BEL04_04915 [Mucilaginibacter sp. PPCGB 2223]|uniref:ester cyclase n=1 Tax=Mucilaginibacter sp. PPCGB 2223 TaxID=1886027 RepID=UPI000824BD75|nr:ester cyclase [Mucilaginibacter sp. PPCGB 2223]OCX53638.1 hypothetical protein BEL04_04915 [Mucilaginibacter sp. PPCGB 2223]